MNSLRQGFRKLSDRQTDTTKIIYHAASRVAKKIRLQIHRPRPNCEWFVFTGATCKTK